MKLKMGNGTPRGGHQEIFYLMLYSSSIFLKLDNDGHTAADRFWLMDTQTQFATVL